MQFWLGAGAIFVSGILLYPSLQPYVAEQHYVTALENRMATQSDALNRYERSNTEINRILSDLLAKVSSAARVRIGIIKPPDTLDNIGSGLKFDMTHGVANTGHLVGTLSIDLPISELNEVLTDLLAHKCSMKRLEELSSLDMLDRYKRLGIQSAYACGIFNPARQMLGVIFMTWDNGMPTPADTELPKIAEMMIHTADTIGARSRK